MTETHSTISVLVADDDDGIRNAIVNILKGCGCNVSAVESVELARDELGRASYQIVFSDLQFKTGDDGDELLDFIKQNHPNTQLVMMSCAMDLQRKEELLSRGASICLRKPFFKDTCLDALAKLIEPKQKAA